MQHPNWSTRLSFIFAAVGSAVGLGNIWKFPYMTGSNGGGAFVLIYLAALFAIAIPVLMSEILVGRHGQLSPPGSMQAVAKKSNASKHWRVFGYWGLFAAFLIMSFYSVIAGWALAYIPKTAVGTLAGLDVTQVKQVYNELLANPVEVAIWQALFILMTSLILVAGVNKGIERAVSFLMPALFLMLMIFVIYAAIAGDFIGAAKYLFTPDFSKLTPQTIMAAIGQALFSLSVGLGAMMTYGAYLPKSINIPRSAAIIAIADTMVALIAGFAIFPIVFGYGLDASEGPGLVFVSLSLSFAHMLGGVFFGTLFFVLLVFAALTTSIGFLEPIVAWAEQSKNIKRPLSLAVICLLVWLTGLATVFSFSIWSDLYLLGQFETFANKTPFDLIDYLIGNVMMPLGALMLVLFVGWKVKNSIRTEELELTKEHWAYQYWLISVKYIAPLIITTLFLLGLFG